MCIYTQPDIGSSVFHFACMCRAKVFLVLQTDEYITCCSMISFSLSLTATKGAGARVAWTRWGIRTRAADSCPTETSSLPRRWCRIPSFSAIPWASRCLCHSFVLPFFSLPFILCHSSFGACVQRGGRGGGRGQTLRKRMFQTLRELNMPARRSGVVESDP